MSGKCRPAGDSSSVALCELPRFGWTQDGGLTDRRVPFVCWRVRHADYRAACAALLSSQIGAAFETGVGQQKSHAYKGRRRGVMMALNRTRPAA